MNLNCLTNCTPRSQSVSTPDARTNSTQKSGEASGKGRGAITFLGPDVTALREDVSDVVGGRRTATAIEVTTADATEVEGEVVSLAPGKAQPNMARPNSAARRKGRKYLPPVDGGSKGGPSLFS